MTMLERLSPLDASFLEVESTTAHMHVGWAASFSPPEEGPRPEFEALLEHIERRLYRAPRYRQRLLPVPFGVNDPVWTDDDRFDIRRHVIRAETSDFGEAVDTVMSAPLDRRRPLWEVWIADELEDGRIGVVGKAHHCMVDGLAAVELASLLLDPEPDAPQPAPETWRPAPRPGSASLLARSLRERIGREFDLVGVPLRVARSPAHLLGFATQAMRATRALARSVTPAPTSRLNEPISPLRHLATCRRPLADLQRVKRHFGTTVNDVVLAAAAGAVRRLLEEHGDPPLQLKAMVPVSVRGNGQALGNEISFMFVNLPCDEPDPVRRLRDVHLATMERKEAGEPDGGKTVLNALRYAPQTLQRIASHAVAGPRAFNLTVSNIPGPGEPLYMLGCELEESYPVVPISDRHAMSIGVTTIKGEACFGVYADRRTLPDADLVAEALDAAVGELLALAEARAGRPVVVTLN